MTEVYNYLPNVPLDGPKKAEGLVAKELLLIPFHERNAINEEVHGVHNISPNESPALLQLSMHLLSIELSKIADKPAFDKSQRLFPNDTYVNTFDFRLRFLRCEIFDAKKAAIRMVTFLDFMDDLFDGNDVLRRPIEITDLSKVEMKILRTGIYQLLPYRDRSGRPVYIEAGDMGFLIDLKIRMRIRMYIYFVASNDIESQKKGMVHIGWPEGDFSNTPMPLHNKNRLLYKRGMASMPIRIAGVHFCMPDTLYFRLLRAFATTSLYFAQRSRLRFHVAEGVERRYLLQGYGIPVEMIPITDSGNVKRAYLYQWIKVRKIIESKENVENTDYGSIILLPGSNDVLIRTGTTTLSHPGNVFFRGLIEMKHNEFRSGSQFTQAFLAGHVVEEIERLNGRFLTWDTRGYWTVLRDRRQILFKVEISIRDFKVKIKARKNVRSANSSTHSFEHQDGNRGKRKKLLMDVDRTQDSSDEDSGPSSCAVFVKRSCG